MTQQGLARVAWGLCLLTLAIVASAVVLVVANAATIRSLEDANPIEIVLPIGFAILGGLAASRQPGNAIGWVFLAIALANGLPALTDQYTRYAVLTEPDAPFSTWITWIGEVTATLVYPAGLAVLAFLLTPNGRFLSPRWRWVAWAGLIGTALEMVLSMTTAVIGDPVAVPNPTRFDPTGRMMDGGPGVIVFLAGLVVLAVAGASVVIRLARSSGEERLQLRWIATATALAIVANIVVTTLSITFLGEAYADIPATIVTVLGFGILLPASFGVAVLRYRLYDLDFILNRTLLYGAVTVVLVAAFFVANLVAQQTLESAFNQRSDLVSAALGVAVGLAFGPMRRAARPLVDRLLPARSRLTLLFTDIVESTQAIVDLGDERWRDVLFRYRSLVRRELSRHRGREINTAGDAFFAVFDRPRSGVACAMAMRDGVKELGLSVRTGLHCGEVEVRGEQISGLAVHTAARVMSQAGGDQILVSDDVAQELDGAAALDEVGTRELRGVPGEWRLYEVRA